MKVDFRTNTSYLTKIVNGESCIISSKVKVEINDVSKSSWLLDNIF